MSAPLPSSPTDVTAAVSAVAADAASAAVVDPTTEPLWRAYASQCEARGVHDLAGLDFSSVAPFLSLNKFHRDALALSRRIPLAPHRLYRTALEMIEKHLCVACWLTHSCCICAAQSQLQMRHKVFLLMHHKEFGRGSNTGKLAVRTELPAAATSSSSAANAAASSAAPVADVTATSALIQLDIAAQERALLDLCEREPLNTVVLFPSKESITIDELCERRGWSRPPQRQEYLRDPPPPTDEAVAAATATAAAAAAAQPQEGLGASPAAAVPAAADLPPCPPLNIILLDGTWRQARSMKYLLPAHIPAIRVDVFKYRLDGTLRDKVEVDVEVAKQMALADGEAQLLDQTVLASALPAATASAAAAAATPTAVDAVVSPVAAPDDAGASSSKGKGKKAAKSQRDPRHREGKKAPLPVASPPVASAEGNDDGDALSPSPSPSAGASTFMSLFYPLRKQSRPDRISTVEALVLLLMSLHEPPSVTYALLDLLRVLVDSMRAQCGMKGVYGSISEEVARQMRIDLANIRKKHADEAKAARLLQAAQAAAAVAGGAASTTEAAAADSASSSSSSSVAAATPVVLLTSKQERRSRYKLSRPCLQWNRGESHPCARTPCRYAHVCIVCDNEPHRAANCEKAMAQQWLADRLRIAAISAGEKSVQRRHQQQQRLQQQEPTQPLQQQPQ